MQPESSGSEDKAKQYPSPFQKRTLWSAVTAVSIVLIGAIAVGAIVLTGTVLGYLQPVLVPLAVAGIIAYLLQPIVDWLIKRDVRPSQAMMLVFIAFLVSVTLLIVAVVVPTVDQATEFYDKRVTIQEQVTELIKSGIESAQSRFPTGFAEEQYQKAVDWVSEEAPNVASNIGQWLWERVRGAFGFLGYLLGLFLVPIYLFFFLREGHKISEQWADYVPIRASKFKDEVVETLTELNGYLISFFRGQMVVSLIDGALVAIGLSLIGLPYALLIGVFLAILGLIPYIGNVLVMIPAVLIAIAHFGATEEATLVEPFTLPKSSEEIVVIPGESSTAQASSDVAAETRADATTIDEAEEHPLVGTVAEVKLKSGKVKKKVITEVMPGGQAVKVRINAWNWLPNLWAYPVIVLGLFLVLQQINGLVTAPKIVGDSVGLHPLTVIFSVLFWSLLLGGLLGALLAVPLTASLKVLIRRYIWEKRIEPAVGRRLGKTGNSPDDSPDAPDENEGTVASA
ncbi:MAG: AI-2E family transporter [Verrucomicrobiota bacterium]